MKKGYRFIGLLLMMLLVLAGCGMTPEKIPETNPEIFTEQPTFTPTPYSMREPIEREPVTEAYSLVPLLSGKPEPIWQLSEGYPLETLLRGTGDTKGCFRILWDEDHLYVQVTVNDKTPTVNDRFQLSDHVVVYVNEDGRKPRKYAVGDYYCVLDRNGSVSYGTGCVQEQIKTVTYETEEGYVAEFCFTLLSIPGKRDATIGFDVAFTDYAGDKVSVNAQWSDNSGHTDKTLQGVGTITLRREDD